MALKSFGIIFSATLLTDLSFIDTTLTYIVKKPNNFLLAKYYLLTYLSFK